MSPMPLHKPVKQNAQQLRQVADEIAKKAADLQALAMAMEESGFPELDVTNYDQLRRALEYVDNYGHAAKSAIRKAREARGDFGSTKHVEKPKRKTTKK
jgi:acyl-CoA reductase-like NAD-dependent aldehyde dehydrogenase